MSKTLSVLTLLVLSAFVGVLVMRLSQARLGDKRVAGPAGPDLEAKLDHLPDRVPALPPAGVESKSRQDGSLATTNLLVPTLESVRKRVPPYGIELELPTNASQEAMLSFRERHGGKALGHILVMRQVRDIVEKEHGLREQAQALREGMPLARILEQMGEPHGVTTGGEPREIDPTTNVRHWKLAPGERPLHNAFVEVWNRQSATPFSKLKLTGHTIELLYSSHPHETKNLRLASPTYKVLYLTIDGRGILIKTEWIECCVGNG